MKSLRSAPKLSVSGYQDVTRRAAYSKWAASSLLSKFSHNPPHHTKGEVLSIPEYLVSGHLRSTTPHQGTYWGGPRYPRIYSILGSGVHHTKRRTGEVLGIPGYLLSGDLGSTTPHQRDIPGRSSVSQDILSIWGSEVHHTTPHQRDVPGRSSVSRDT